MDKMEILVAGQIGCGKTTMIEGLFGKSSGTKSDTMEFTDEKGRKFIVYDLLGLNDPAITDEKVIYEMAQKVKSVNLILLCFNMRSRVTKADVDIMKRITQCFGKEISDEDKDSRAEETKVTQDKEKGEVSANEDGNEGEIQENKTDKEEVDKAEVHKEAVKTKEESDGAVWKKVICVLTFANEVVPESPSDSPLAYFNDALDEYKSSINGFIGPKIGVSESAAEEISVPVAPAGKKGEFGLPNTEDWRKDLMTKITEFVSAETVDVKKQEMPPSSGGGGDVKKQEMPPSSGGGGDVKKQERPPRDGATTGGGAATGFCNECCLIM